MHLEHPRTSLWQEDPLLDMSNVGSMDSTLAVDLSVAEDMSNACN